MIRILVKTSNQWFLSNQILWFLQRFSRLKCQVTAVLRFRVIDLGVGSWERFLIVCFADWFVSRRGWGWMSERLRLATPKGASHPRELRTSLNNDPVTPRDSSLRSARIYCLQLDSLLLAARFMVVFQPRGRGISLLIGGILFKQLLDLLSWVLREIIPSSTDIVLSFICFNGSK